MLTQDWIDKLSHYHKLYVGFSGGLDSTVLLHSLVSQSPLIGKLCAIHVHHGLSPNADHWQVHCQKLCDTLNIPLLTRQIQLSGQSNIEEGARIARYQVFKAVLTRSDCLLLAHHCDDQAETLLLNLLRGTGIDGLAGMKDLMSLGTGKLARPLLYEPRHTLEGYAHEHRLTWIDDESNVNHALSRNYLRHQVVPLFKKKWPAFASNLARAAMHCQKAQDNLQVLAMMDDKSLSEGNNQLPILPIKTLGPERIINVLRLWIKKNNARMPSAKIFERLIDEMIQVNDDKQPCIQWGGTVIRRYQGTLYLFKKTTCDVLINDVAWLDFPNRLYLEQGGYVQVVKAKAGIKIPVGSRISVRFRKGGELFYWRGQSKQLKKLWQQWQVPPWQRETIPLIYIDDILAAVAGFAVSDHFYGSDLAYQIEYYPDKLFVARAEHD